MRQVKTEVVAAKVRALSSNNALQFLSLRSSPFSPSKNSFCLLCLFSFVHWLSGWSSNLFFWRSPYHGAAMSVSRFDHTIGASVHWLFVKTALTLSGVGLLIGLASGALVSLGERWLRGSSATTKRVDGWRHPTQLVGPERRERVSHHTWCGEGCVNSRRPVDSDVGFLRILLGDSE